MNNTIYLDIDGCVAGFLESACDLFSIDLNDYDTRALLKAQPLHESLVPKKEFWKQIDFAGENFWANLPLLPWAKQLWAHCNELSAGRTYFCTAPSMSPHSLSGKHRWITKHFKTNKFVITAHKHLLASPTTLLIDDRSKFCDPFMDNDGKAYLWPNELCIEDGNISLQTCLDDIKELTKWT